MTHLDEPAMDEDLTPRFRWRWHEHGVYLGVCTVIGTFVLMLHMLPEPPRRPIAPLVWDLIHVRYLSSVDEPPMREDPFHDPRVIQPRRKAVQRPPRSPAL
jgi:hypothetical protein